jgi:RNA polymerase sigma-70 factor (ECF subfamily)
VKGGKVVRSLLEFATMAATSAETRVGAPTDAELVRRAGDGDTAAFAELTGRYYRPVCGFLYKRLGRADLVEDLAQETFLEALRGLRAGQQPEHFGSWLFGIAANRCGKWFRKRRPALFAATEPPDSAVTPFVSMQEELEEQEKVMRALEANLAELTPQTRTLLRLKHRDGKSCAEIAAQLGQPLGTIKSQLSRTYKLLRARLSGLTPREVS